MSLNTQANHSLANIDTRSLGRWFLLDTTIIIEATKSDSVMRFLGKMVEDGCELFTIPDVLVEFVRRAKDRAQHNIFKNLFERLNISILDLRNDYYESDEFMYMYHHDAEKGQEIHTEAVYKYDKSKFLKRQRQLT